MTERESKRSGTLKLKGKCPRRSTSRWKQQVQMSQKERTWEGTDEEELCDDKDK
jgi:hypothetical protein